MLQRIVRLDEKLMNPCDIGTTNNFWNNSAVSSHLFFFQDPPFEQSPNDTFRAVD